MSRSFAYLGFAGYILLCVGVFIWWTPHFFMANTHRPVELSYAYLTGSGLPFAFLMATVIARQSLMPQFSFNLAMQALFSALILACALYVFYYPPQAQPLAQIHIWLTVVLVAWNLFQYRRALKEIERKKKKDASE